MKFSHFLLTQFNLRNFPQSSATEYDKWTDWTRNRIQLFKTYCLPSILNQTEKDFIWLIYFDSTTPDEFKPFIDELRSYGFIKICYSNGSDDFFKNYLNEVKSRLTQDSKWVITTRLDNDDMLHQSAISLIQENFLEKNNYLIALSSGYVLDLDKKVLSHYFYPMSPFISLIESVSENMVGVFGKLHTQWQALRLFIFKELYFEFVNKSARKARFILKNPLWIQTVHGANVSNSFFRGLPVIKSKNLIEFGLAISTIKMELSELFKYRSYVIWKRYFKCWLIKIILNK
jgi:hypothetical protein